MPASNDLTQQHNGCPLAEIWITRYASSTTGRRRKLQINPGPVQVDPSTGQALPTLQAYEDMQEGGVAVATAQPIPRYAWDFRFTNGERPYMLRIPDYFSSNTDGSRDYDAAPFFATYGGTLKFDVSDRNCWYLDSRFCSGFHRFKQTFGGPEAGRTAITSMCWGISLLSAIMLICTRTGFIRFCRHRKFRTIDRDGGRSG